VCGYGAKNTASKRTNTHQIYSSFDGTEEKKMLKLYVWDERGEEPIETEKALEASLERREKEDLITFLLRIVHCYFLS
jgi:hypothetical protein